MKAKRYSKFKMFLLWCLSLTANLLPLVIVLAINYKYMVTTKEEGFALTVTGVVWVLFLLISLKGTLPFKMNRCVTLIIVYVLLELMKPLLSYMSVFAGACALGSLIDIVIIKPMIVKYREVRQATKTADMTTEQIKVAVAEIIEERGGRA
ncbi:MAG: hypothetical protein IKA85_06735 [Clostridia bacterium]|nr:hypothetical protein [Clostridia bacterium]